MKQPPDFSGGCFEVKARAFPRIDLARKRTTAQLASFFPAAAPGLTSTLLQSKALPAVPVCASGPTSPYKSEAAARDLSRAAAVGCETKPRDAPDQEHARSEGNAQPAADRSNKFPLSNPRPSYRAGFTLCAPRQCARAQPFTTISTFFQKPACIVSATRRRSPRRIIGTKRNHGTRHDQQRNARPSCL